MIRWIAIVLSMVLIVQVDTTVASDNLTVNGYFKNFSTVLDFAKYTGPGNKRNEPLLGSVSNRLRMKSRWRLSDRISFDAAYDLAGKIQDRRLITSTVSIAQINPFSYRAIDFDKYLYPRHIGDAESFAVSQNLDRCFATIHSPKFDLFVGRQAIAWGSARVINPTDVIAPYAFNELDTEDRVGVDAVRLRYPLGFMGEIDAGYVFGDEFRFDQSAFFTRCKFYYAGSDVSVMLIGFRENLLAGFDLARSIGGAGFWTEAAYVFAKALSDSGVISGESYFRSSIGVDYNFAGGLYGFVEYHFNQAGSIDQNRYLAKYSTTAYTEGAVYLLGRHYLCPGFSYQLTPLITLGGQVLLNVTDPSMLIAPTLDYNISENIYIGAGAYAGLGNGLRLRPTADWSSIEPSIGSEFGVYPDIYYTSFRIYF
jgi:hypothetical protein